MQNIIVEMKGFATLIRYVWLALMLICAASYCGVSQAKIDLGCGQSAATPLNLGSVDVLQGIPPTVSGTLTYSCKNAKNQPGYAVLCFSISTGDPGTSYEPRQLVSTVGSNNKLNFQIYKDSAKSLPWGIRNMPSSGGPLVVVRSVSADERITGDIPIYAAVAPNQFTAVPESYTLSFTRARDGTEIAWREISVAEFNSPVPTLCDSAVLQNRFPFTATATVAKKCWANATELNFGAVSSINATPVVGMSTLNVQCNIGVPFQVGLSNGINSVGNDRYMKKTTGADLTRYELFTDAARTARWGNTKDVDTLRDQANTTGTGYYTALNVYGRAYPDSTLSAGDYADTVTVILYF